MAQSPTQPVTAARYASWLKYLESQPSARPLPTTPPGVEPINLTWGMPSPDLFPLDAMERAVVKAVREQTAAALLYGEHAGMDDLRAIVARRLATQGINVSAGQVIITSGALQALDLVGRVFLEPGDTIAVEEPTFVNAMVTWRSYRPNYITIPIDGDGMIVDDLERQLKAGAPVPKFIYALPTYQNPTGVSLSLERRKQLLALAREWGMIVVEDDPYSNLWFEESSILPAISALPGSEEHVVYVGTFSKTLAPGLRVGFIVGSPEFYRRLWEAKRSNDYQTDGLAQQTVINMIEDRDLDFDRHIAWLRGKFQERRDALLDALEIHAPAGTTWTRPAGGFFTWINLPPGVSGARVQDLAAQEGVMLVSGGNFHVTGGDHTLRLAFSFEGPEKIARAAEILGKVIERARP